MGRFESRWTEQQREAIERAHCDKGHTFAAIHRAAQQGELPHEGADLDPFDIPYATVREIATREAKRRAGKAHSQLVSKPAETASEEIRRRLVSILDHETLRIGREIEKAPKKAVNAEHLRKLARAAFEVERLGSARATPVRAMRAPSHNRQDGSIGGRILSVVAPKAIAAPAQDGQEQNRRINVPSNGAMAENGGAAAHDDDDATTSGAGGGAPVDYARNRLAGLAVSVDLAPKRA